MSVAQTVPDAGRVLQELEQPPTKPKQDRQFPMLAPQAMSGVQPGGTVVEIRAVHIIGNSVFSSAVLIGQLGNLPGKKLDLAGLHALAHKITAYYRLHGYPFTRAFIPQQDISQGELRIQVMEGRYGRVAAGGDPALEHGVTRFLRSLHSGNRSKRSRSSACCCFWTISRA